MDSTDSQLPASTVEPAILVEDVSFGSNGTRILRSISLSVEKGRIAAIVGPNGAGKTTFFDVLCGRIVPQRGRVVLAGRNQNGLDPAERSALGLGRLFQEVRVFPRLSLLENVRIAFPDQRGETVLGALLGRSWERRRRDLDRRAVNHLKKFALEKDESRMASQLSFGQQKLLSLATLIASEARILLLDEPTSGLAPGMAEVVLTAIRDLCVRDGRTVLLIEHDLDTVEQLAEMVFWLEGGEIVDRGSPRDVIGRRSRRDARSRVLSSRETELEDGRE